MADSLLNAVIAGGNKQRTPDSDVNRVIKVVRIGEVDRVVPKRKLRQIDFLMSGLQIYIV